MNTEPSIIRLSHKVDIKVRWSLSGHLLFSQKASLGGEAGIRSEAFHDDGSSSTTPANIETHLMMMFDT
jgi:hypothetical protein